MTVRQDSEVPSRAQLEKEFHDLKESFAQRARETSYPGATDGPADAYRHMLAAAEVTRRYTWLTARVVGNRNEGSLIPDRAKLDEASNMDLDNNRIGEKIGKIAKNFEEAERMVRAEINAAALEGGSGKNGTARYLDPGLWKGDTERKAPIAWPPPHLAKSSEVERILGRPPRTWTEEETRKVQADPIYWNSNHPRQAEAFAAVRQWHEQRYDKRKGNGSGRGAGASGGPVQVRSYARDDGTKVDAHTRSAPALHGR